MDWISFPFYSLNSLGLGVCHKLASRRAFSGWIIVLVAGGRGEIRGNILPPWDNHHHVSIHPPEISQPNNPRENMT
jgi:hypothetical protein